MSAVEHILLHDKLAEHVIPRYEVEPKDNHLVFNPHTYTIVKHTEASEIVIPLVDDKNLNWDKILVYMLEACAKLNDAPKIQTTNLNYEGVFRLDIDSYFEEQKLIASSVLVNPINEYYMLLPLEKVVTSDWCPENVAFFLPPSAFLGVYVERGQENGIGIINTKYVLRVELTPNSVDMVQ